ncbi:hypothetical protein [Clostridium paraputrificum]|uniref:hypothetical protein n=1 Tax=Clostridium sp. TaxID=1506 RepID=UPI0012E88360|nr:hypothetical protein [Clostridium sp.]MBS5987929.1 hypothetical protein [Clostridium sp.]
MNNNISKIWFFAAVCFIIVGIASKNTTYIVLGCAYICIGCYKQNEKINSKDDENK